VHHPPSLSLQFLISLANFTPSTKEEKIKFAFTIFDVNGDNTIDKGELIQILKANHMAGSDKEVEKKADTILRHADSNNDNVVSWGKLALNSALALAVTGTSAAHPPTTPLSPMSPLSQTSSKKSRRSSQTSCSHPLLRVENHIAS